jgi:sugar/nucleoside kinase (ribokinase family)
MIPEAYWSPQAIYIFAGVTEPAWEVVGQVRSPTTVLWELDVAVCEPAFTARVRAMSVQADLISINEQELRKLVGGASSGDLRRTLDEVFPGVAAIALRRGADGAVLATRDGVWIARPDQGRSVVDPTGAGNAFSGALSVAWTLTRGDPRAALRSAMAAAAVTVVHQGVTLPMTPELRTDYAQIADSQKVESLTWQEFLQ